MRKYEKVSLLPTRQRKLRSSFQRSQSATKIAAPSKRALTMVPCSGNPKNQPAMVASRIEPARKANIHATRIKDEELRMGSSELVTLLGSLRRLLQKVPGMTSEPSHLSRKTVLNAGTICYNSIPPEMKRSRIHHPENRTISTLWVHQADLA